MEKGHGRSDITWGLDRVEGMKEWKRTWKLLKYSGPMVLVVKQEQINTETLLLLGIPSTLKRGISKSQGPRVERVYFVWCVVVGIVLHILSGHL